MSRAWSRSRFTLLLAMCSLLAGAWGCNALGSVPAPGALGAASEQDRMVQRCNGVLKGVIEYNDMTDPDVINNAIDAIQSQDEGCGIPIWNPLSTDDPQANECLRGLVRDQIAAGALGGDAVFISMNATAENPTGEGCFMYHARRGTWIDSGLNHARWYMMHNECRSAPGAMAPPAADCDWNGDGLSGPPRSSQ